MHTYSPARWSQLPLRWRLTLWYLLTLGLILLLFSGFLYLQLRANLLDQLDVSLQRVAAQTAVAAGADGTSLVFQDVDSQNENTPAAADPYFRHLAAADGTVWDRAGRAVTVPSLASPGPGLVTVREGDDQWRVFSQEITIDGIQGWLQVVGDLDPISDTLERLLTLMLIGGPLALTLAGGGGVFLASRALRPVDAMTRTAQSISASDLSRRMGYEGPADEIGRLAQTFDAMLDRLQTAFDRERRFTGDAAHELRTPLTALKGRLGVTLSQPRRAQAYVETLEEMEEQVDRLIHLSSDLLYMARLEQGQIARQVEPIAVRDFLGAIVDQIRPLANAKSIEIAEAVPVELTLHGDLDLLVRLFLNLLDNAVKYTPPGGRIAVQALAKAGLIQVTIADTGPGIAPEHLPHLFERFYRVESDRARQGSSHHGGAGLGLAIAHEIARSHGGILTVQSELGQGTTFFVEFPVQRTHAPTA